MYKFTTLMIQHHFEQEFYEPLSVLYELHERHKPCRSFIRTFFGGCVRKSE
jgi:hypothetical protein